MFAFHFAKDGYYIGSREELLHFEGDRIWNPAQGIVEGLIDIAYMVHTGQFTVVYGEFYGGKTTANAKNYTGEQNTGFRVFDVAVYPDWLLASLLSMEPYQIAHWRDAGNQPFLPFNDVLEFCQINGLIPVPTLWVKHGSSLPYTVADTLPWLREIIPNTFALLDAGARKMPEGAVIRSFNRKLIAKVRYQDYERSLKNG